MSTKQNICFIINPISGVGRQKTVEKLIDELLDKTRFQYSLAYTKAAKHATELARQAASEGADIVVAVGGDGSVNEVAKGLIGSSAALAILPAGSGNGLARHLGVPMDLTKAITMLQNGQRKKMDSIQFNEEHFVNVAGVGFDAHIGWEFAKFGKRGLSSYVKVTLRELANLQTQPFELQLDGKTIYTDAYLIGFANGSQWGNNASIAPMADVTDGLMDVVIVKKFPLINSISIGYKLFRKKLHTSNAVEFFKAKEVTLKQTSDIAHIDGEPILCGKTVTIKVNALSLNVIAPLH